MGVKSRRHLFVMDFRHSSHRRAYAGVNHLLARNERRIETAGSSISDVLHYISVIHQ